MLQLALTVVFTDYIYMVRQETPVMVINQNVYSVLWDGNNMYAVVRIDTPY